MKKAVWKRIAAKLCLLMAATGIVSLMTVCLVTVFIVTAAVPVQAADTEEDAVAPVAERVPLADQLLLLNAVCAMWSVHNNFTPCHGDMDMPLENMVSPESVFAHVVPGPEERLDGVYENSGEVYRVETAEGVPVIAVKESFYIVASRKNDGHYHIDKLDFSKIER